MCSCKDFDMSTLYPNSNQNLVAEFACAMQTHLSEYLLHRWGRCLERLCDLQEWSRALLDEVGHYGLALRLF